MVDDDRRDTHTEIRGHGKNACTRLSSSLARLMFIDVPRMPEIGDFAAVI